MNASRIEQILKEFDPVRRDALIPLLQRVQEEEGYLSESAIADIGHHLSLPVSKVYGVATFYNQFRFHPRGRFHFMVCRGTACHVKGSLRLLDALVAHLKVRPGHTSRDGVFSLEVVACMGACGLAPAINLNGDVIGKMTPKRVERLISECRQAALATGEANHVR